MRSLSSKSNQSSSRLTLHSGPRLQVQRYLLSSRPGRQPPSTWALHMPYRQDWQTWINQKQCRRYRCPQWHFWTPVTYEEILSLGTLEVRFPTSEIFSWTFYRCGCHNHRKCHNGRYSTDICRGTTLSGFTSQIHCNIAPAEFGQSKEQCQSLDHISSPAQAKMGL